MSMRTLLWVILLLYSQVNPLLAGAKVQRVSGEVNVRQGVEETWLPAQPGMLLEDIDTILTGGNGEVVIESAAGDQFTLGRNALLEVSDLKKITEKELFLFLMAKKVQKIEPGAVKTQLRIGNVSVVHGEYRANSDSGTIRQAEPGFWLQEKNGARALYMQKFYPNAIIKYHKILEKYASIPDCGEIHFCLGQSFEAIQHHGQAVEAYKVCLVKKQEQQCADPEAIGRANRALQAIEKLSPRN